MAPASCMKKGEGSCLLTWINVDSDHNMHPLTCHVVNNVCHQNGVQLAMWCCHCLGMSAVEGWLWVVILCISEVG